MLRTMILKQPWLLLLLLVLAACAPETVGVVFPADYPDGYIHYATVDRPDGVIRDLLVDAAALDAFRGGRGLPVDTHIVLRAFTAERDADGALRYDAAGRLVRGEPHPMLHIAEKRSNWTAADFPTDVRAGQWNYGSFSAETGATFDEDLAACLNCHQARPATDFVFSLDLLRRYARSGEVQYLYCDLRSRVAC